MTARPAKDRAGDMAPATEASATDALTEEDFQEIVEVFRILFRIRNEERRKAYAGPTTVEG